MGGGTGEKPSLDGVTPLLLKNYPFLTPSRQSVAARRAAIFGPLDNTRDQVIACVEIARRAGLDFLVLDQTRPDVEVPGGPRDRSGSCGISTALWTGPALRCSGQARLA